MKHITVGIPVYNEQRNIAQLVASLEMQEKESLITIDSIIVCDDGSSDNTVKVVQDLSVNNPWVSSKLILLKNEKNSGKSFSLRKIFALFLEQKSDFLLLLDSDMLAERDDIFEKILQPFVMKPETSMVGGWYSYPKNPNPLSRVLSFSLEIIKHIGSFQGSYVCSGGILCLRKDFVRILDMPVGITRIDLYLYLQTIVPKLEYVFQPEAVVTDTKDFADLDFNWFVRIQSRATKMPDYLFEKYSKEEIKKHTEVSVFAIVSSLILCLIKHPIDGVYYLAYKLFAKLKIMFAAKTKDVLWRK